MNAYTELAQAIVRYQESIIGPLAWSEARKISGLEVNGSIVTVKADGKKTLTLLVHRYELLFGQASIEACKDAIKELNSTLSENDLPEILR